MVFDTTYYRLNEIDQTEDCSAIKYYVQGYYFTRWINNCIANGMTGTDTQFKGDESTLNRSFKEIFTINKENNPDDVDSKFSKHKRKTIENQINDSLAQAIRNYAGESTQDYRLPLLNANDWDQILSNVSMVAFMQQIPVGFKVYNNYAIATSTNNREVVDPNEIYFINSTDNYYHRCYCDKTDFTTNLTGYRSVDFVEKIGYTYEDAGEEKTNYYFLHSDTSITSSMACYYCLINRADYVKTDTHEINYEIAYNTALARERYKSKQDVILAKEYAEFEVMKSVEGIYKPDGTLSSNDYAVIGDTIKWKITIKNVGEAGGYVRVYDLIPNGLIFSNETDFAGLSDNNTDANKIDGKLFIDKGLTKNLIVVTDVKDDVELGMVVNTVVIKDESGEIKIDSASAHTRIEQELELTTSASGSGSEGDANIIIVADCSWSMIEMMDGKTKITGVRDKIKNILLMDEFYAEGRNCNVAIIPFAALTTGTGGSVVSPSNFTISNSWTGSECVTWSKLKSELQSRRRKLFIIKSRSK